MKMTSTRLVALAGLCLFLPQIATAQRSTNGVVRTADGRLKLWWVWEDGSKLAGKCGATAPRINGQLAECDPLSDSYYCCSKWGYCGSSAEYCDCPDCVNYKRLAAIDPRRVTTVRPTYGSRQ